jgi:hypothetical protein
MSFSYWMLSFLICILVDTRGELHHIKTDGFLIIFIACLFFLWVFITIKHSHHRNKEANTQNEASFFPQELSFYLALICAVNVIGKYHPIFLFFEVMLCVLYFLPIKILPWFMLILSLSLIYILPNPDIDVFISNSLAADFLLKGLNPYAQIYPDIYHGFYDYKPGFLYWPGTLYLQSLSKFLFGDIRVALILAWWAAPFLFPNTKVSEKIKKIWWLLPTLPFSFFYAWVDPFISFFAALALWAQKNKKYGWLVIAIASAASIKQYGFIVGFFILISLLTQKKWGEFYQLALYSFLAFLLLLAPFLFWNFSAFLDMTITNHLNANPRIDAFNFIGLILHLNKALEVKYIYFLGLISTSLAFILAIYHINKNSRKNQLSVIAEAWVIVFGTVIFFGKFAFYNYYALLISLIILSKAFSRGYEERAHKI